MGRRAIFGQRDQQRILVAIWDSVALSVLVRTLPVQERSKQPGNCALRREHTKGSKLLGGKVKVEAMYAPQGELHCIKRDKEEALVITWWCR